ncbi:VIT family protein [Phycicoccus endophyticus]|uniref:VIT family protein n=1 Tax=Phycicoccus endophyticus TaxID=1690220 RepID=A0A7G9QZ16_9MICO|nr:VIT family protein [Phycicoccus endophyticus]NHI18931.1 VIT family protein [Phycicoccus endophyticus]QNN48591.1 VIT family protein [Phycicoccus endophyticus]GGL31466.1 membrane protein [Phycicoccus endophyticus]
MADHPSGAAALAGHDEPHDHSYSQRLNWLRAGVLGANDGIVSTAALVIGVAAATTDRGTVLTAGLAGLAAGAMSMAVGEYVSVSTQRDTERALIAKETRELAEEPDAELAELAGFYEAKGLSPDLAEQVAVELTRHDALAAHAEVELRIDPENLTNPWQAAWASMLSFTLGAVVPLLAVVLPAQGWRVPVTVLAVVVALAGTGLVSARLGEADARRATVRVVAGGLLAMAVTYGIGSLLGTETG